MHVIKATGLVPVKALVTIDNMTAGKIFGMKPESARVALKNKEVALVDIPPHLEVEKVAGPQADEPPVVKKEEDGPVPIPEKWAEEHALFWIALAKKITGHAITVTDEQKQAGIKVSDVAKGIIEQELERRAAAETDPDETGDDKDKSDQGGDTQGGGGQSQE